MSEAVTVHKVSTQHPGQWPQGATAVITVAVGLYTAADRGREVIRVTVVKCAISDTVFGTHHILKPFSLPFVPHRPIRHEFFCVIISRVFNCILW